MTVELNVEPVSAMQHYINTTRQQIEELEVEYPELAGHLGELLLRYRRNQSMTIGMHLDGNVIVVPRDREERIAFLSVLRPIADYHHLLYEVIDRGVKLFHL